MVGDRIRNPCISEMFSDKWEEVFKNLSKQDTDINSWYVPRA